MTNIPLAAASDFYAVGDVEGCYWELLELLEKLGYRLVLSQDPLPRLLDMQGPCLFGYVGDLITRGPHSDLVINLAEQMVARGMAFSVRGNKEQKHINAYTEPSFTPDDQNRRAMQLIASHGPVFERRALEFMCSMPIKFETEDHIVVHGAYREGVDDAMLERLAIWGETDGLVTAGGYPVLSDRWETEYCGKKTIIHGHMAVDEVVIRELPCGGCVANLDTKAAYGVNLTAMRASTRKIVQVRSRAAYARWYPH
jgi:protein phosphatase